MTPLTDLRLGTYLGFPGGLYPHGQNSPPSAYYEAGMAAAATVGPLDEKGRPSPSGKVGMVAIGMSNTSREFSEFIQLASSDTRTNPRLAMIDAAQDGAAATDIAVPLHGYWRHVDRQLQREEIRATQVQVVWLKTALAREHRAFPISARLLQRTLRSVLGILKTKFPQLKLVYLSSRTYGGYSETDLSPEPIAYEAAFAVKWLIEDRINCLSRDLLPWVSWGPYLWADGMAPRSDSLTWERSDFEPDGVHTSAQGAWKVATRLLAFFTTEATARPWFLES